MPAHDAKKWIRTSGRGVGVLGIAVAAVCASTITTTSSAQVRGPAEATAPARGISESLPEFPSSRGGKARNVIFIQGDGMGIAHRELIRLATKGQNGELAMNKMDYAGLRAHRLCRHRGGGDRLGRRRHRLFHRGPHLQRRDRCRRRTATACTTCSNGPGTAGKATGLVTTSQVTDASPAAFAAHVADRGDQSEIARQIIEDTRSTSCWAAARTGGTRPANPGAWPDNPPKDPTEQSKGTEGNLVQRARDLDYQYVTERRRTGRCQARQGARPVRQRGDVRVPQRGRGRPLRAVRAAEDDVPQGARPAVAAIATASSCSSRRKASTRWRTTATPS